MASFFFINDYLSNDNSFSTYSVDRNQETFDFPKGANKEHFGGMNPFNFYARFIPKPATNPEKVDMADGVKIGQASNFLAVEMQEYTNGDIHIGKNFGLEKKNSTLIQIVAFPLLTSPVRGHLAAAADFGSNEEKKATYNFLNIVPMVRCMD